MAGSFDRYGHLMACPKAAYSNAIIQVLANDFCLNLLLSAPDMYVPKPGEHGQTHVRPFDVATGETARVHPGLA